MKKCCFCCLIACLIVLGGRAQTYEKTAQGMILTLPSSDKETVCKVRLEVMGERIVRVSATPRQEFSTAKSLVIVPQEGQTPFIVDERGDELCLRTARMQAIVNRHTGEVRFTDLKGRTLLSEEAGGGRSFTPIEVDGDKGYTVRQVFRSPGDEALYGLGQHQADEFNYKGKNEELFQYNTKVSVPFVVSSRRYGVLWDSYSLVRFGNHRPYRQLHDAFKLFDKDGQPGGLTAIYTRQDKDKAETLTRREDSLYYESLETLAYLPAKMITSRSHVTYEGMLEPGETGEYRFILYYAGYVKVYIDGRLVVPERWRTAWNPNCYKFAVPMEQGKRVSVKIDWRPDGSQSYLGLRALTPVPSSEQEKMSWWSEMADQVDYYFMAGDTMDEVIAAYRRLTGKAPVMPRWAMGFWQSRERYKTQKELVGTLQEFRRRCIPVDNIVQDWSYWPEDAWGSHEFDPTRYPDPQAMLDSVHAMHGRFMISVWPKFYASTEHYKEFDRQGWMYRRAVNDSIRDWIGPGYIGSFYDAYSPGARRLFWQQMNEHLYKLGVDAWWMDASEPDIQSNASMDYRKQLCGPTALGSSTRYFNAYSLVNAEAIYDGQRSVDPDKRVFLLTRSGFVGLQRYSTATWSGDIGTRWEDMKAQISAGLNFALSGIPYWTMDIGGFCVENRYVKGQKEYNKTRRENADYREWRELNTRWYQFGAFAPLYRAHGQYPYREVWNIAPEGHPAYESITYYIRLRYRLMPYIYSLAGMTYFDDYTIMRPLAMDFTDDRRALDVSDQYMFGPSLLVCPVYRYEARSREVYFPGSGRWYEAYSGRVAAETAGTLTVDAPYGRIPLFVRAGAIVPYGPELQYTDEQPADTMTLYVYTGRDGNFTLYEDEGVNYGYERGAFARVPFIYSDAQGTLTIGARSGSFPGMLAKRTFRIVFVSPGHPQGLGEEQGGQVVSYDGREITVRLSHHP